jgi:hypothetical protein
MISFKEKFYDAIRQKLDRVDYEVFVNPSSKELKELQGTSRYGVRFLINFKTKEIFFFSGDMLHKTFMDNSPDCPRYREYTMSGKGLDYIFTGTMLSNSYESDNINYFYQENKYKKELKLLLAQDWSWLSKWINVQEVQKLIVVQ